MEACLLVREAMEKEAKGEEMELQLLEVFAGRFTKKWALDVWYLRTSQELLDKDAEPGVQSALEDYVTVEDCTLVDIQARCLALTR